MTSSTSVTQDHFAFMTDSEGMRGKTRLEVALEYIANGWKVLPLQPKGKTPYQGQGVKHATNDPLKVKAWFDEEPTINIGIATGNGLLVIDADSKEAIENLQSKLPPTRTVSTGKGRHFYLATSQTFKNSVGKLGEHIDTRSLGGYVVAPPSMHENGTSYSWEDENIPIAPLPTEIEKQLLEPTPKPAIQKRETRAEQEIPEGQRNDALTRIAGSLANRAIPAGFTIEDFGAVLQDRNNRQCKPPLPAQDVDAIVTHIFEAERQKLPTRTLKLLSRADIDSIPDPEFLIEHYLVKNSLAILYGQPGVAKTFLALDMALSVSTGRTWCGRKVAPAPVVYVCAEGVSGMKRRLEANEFGNGVRSEQFYLVGQGIQLHQPAMVGEFITLLIEQDVRPGLIVFDTLSRCSVGLDENTAQDMNLVIAGLDHIKTAFDATVLGIHHSTKADKGVMRGSSALLGGVDTSLCLTKNASHERVLKVTKQKDAEEAHPLTFRLEHVPQFDSAVPVLIDKKTQETILSDNETAALAALAALESASSTDWMKKSELGKSTFQRARKNLVDRGLVSDEGGLYHLPGEVS